jgi:hypothetical protein
MYARDSKYHAKKQEIDGHTFDSQAEARRYIYLRNLEKLGVIKNLELQPRFLLQEKFITNDRNRQHGRTIRKVEYIADFSYYRVQNGERVVEDVKGVKTAEYKLKKKLFLRQYQDQVTFYEIGLKKSELEGYM